MKSLILSLLISFSALFASAQSADELFTAKDYDKAANAYITILKTDTGNVSALRRLAFCYLNSNTNEIQASIYFKKALHIDSNDVASNYYMGIMSKNALKKDLKADQRIKVTADAKSYLAKAASLGNEDAKNELASLK